MKWLDYTYYKTNLLLRHISEENQSKTLVVADPMEGVFDEKVLKAFTGLGFTPDKEKLIAPFTVELFEKLGRAKNAKQISIAGVGDVLDSAYYDDLEQSANSNSESPKIILVTYKDPDKRSQVFVSHGIDTETLKNVVMSPEPLDYYIRYCGARLDQDSHEYYLENPKPTHTEETASGMRA